MVNQQRTTRVQYFTGLDLGQAQQFTALAVLEKTSVGDRGNPDGWTSTTPSGIWSGLRSALPTPRSSLN